MAYMSASHFQVNSRAVEALNRRLRKELRQKAILEEFAAK